MLKRRVLVHPEWQFFDRNVTLVMWLEAPTSYRTLRAQKV